jgi:hypothetical protein
MKFSIRDLKMEGSARSGIHKGLQIRLIRFAHPQFVTLTPA